MGEKMHKPMLPQRIGLRVAYDGTAYAGWQRQNNGLAVQEVIEEAIFGLFSERVRLDASGRTDAGVHALGQIAAMTLCYPIPTDRLVLALNSRLPEDIRILEAWKAEPDFHPQYMAKRKNYCYTYFNGPFLLPQYRLTMGHIHETMDLAAINEALSSLEGTHDFEALSASGRTAKTTVRTVYRAHASAEPVSLLHPEDGQIVRIEITGNGFLYNMVRIIAGTCADIGRHRLPTTIFLDAIERKDRTILGMTAPAKGLTLLNVEYV